MKHHIAVLLVIGLLSPLASVSAQIGQGTMMPDYISAYRQYRSVGPQSIPVPRVVEMPLGSEFLERYDFAVYDETAKAFEPYYFRQETYTNLIPLTVTSNTSSYSNSMTDNDTRTYAEFFLPELYGAGPGTAQITVVSQQPVASSMLTVLLDSNVALPTFVEIRAVVDGQNRVVVSSRRMDSSTVRFPKTTSNRWTVSLTYAQPLRITEFKLHQDNANTSSVRMIRFLAQPSHSYKVYFDPDRRVNVPVSEAGNYAFLDSKEILQLPMTAAQRNPAYQISDVDRDGVPDVLDNCVQTANTDQADVNANGRGDVCDDFDQDGLTNERDNCPNNPNRDQADADSDGIGNVCDTEESRITEKYPWLPWVGIGFAGVVLVVLFVLTARSTPPPPRQDDDIPLENPKQ